MDTEKKGIMNTNTEYKIPPELADIIPGYLERRELDIQALKIFALNDDFTSVAKLGHKLKGNGSSFGFDRISELGSLLMRSCENKNMLEIKKLITDFEKEVRNIKKCVFV